MTIAHGCAFIALFTTLIAIFLIIKAQNQERKSWLWRRKKKKKEGFDFNEILHDLYMEHRKFKRDLILREKGRYASKYHKDRLISFEELYNTTRQNSTKRSTVSELQQVKRCSMNQK